MSFTIKTLLLAVALIATALLGFYLGRVNVQRVSHKPSATDTAFTKKDRKILYYRNPMGLADTSPVPKKDPMGMDYIPVYADDLQEEGAVVRVTPERIQTLGVRTETAQLRTLYRSVRAMGTIQPDEKSMTVIAPRFDGWIEKLIVNTTGQQIKKGDPLLELYSPELVNIESEYLISSDIDSNGSIERLRTLAVPQEEIDRLIQTKTTNNRITLRATADGTVMEKTAVEGMRFSQGEILYRFADLSNVWLLANIYEQDLPYIAVGQQVAITLDINKNKKFIGKISFIYPDINKDTRTAKVRIELPNTDGNLRTDMYAQIGVMAKSAENVLTVSTSAIIDNGEQKVVIVDLGQGRFKPQTVETGVEGGGYIEIIDGLKEGDKVVTSASFLIDAESNIREALQNFSATEKQQ